MARVIGDRGIFFYVQDVAVRPKFQRQGVGARLMEAALGYLERAAPPGAFVGLFATAEAQVLYERYGFAVLPLGLTGMGRLVHPVDTSA